MIECLALWRCIEIPLQTYSAHPFNYGNARIRSSPDTGSHAALSYSHPGSNKLPALFTALPT